MCRERERQRDDCSQALVWINSRFGHGHCLCLLCEPTRSRMAEPANGPEVTALADTLYRYTDIDAWNCRLKMRCISWWRLMLIPMYSSTDANKSWWIKLRPVSWWVDVKLSPTRIRHYQCPCESALNLYKQGLELWDLIYYSIQGWWCAGKFRNLIGLVSIVPGICY